MADRYLTLFIRFFYIIQGCKTRFWMKFLKRPVRFLYTSVYLQKEGKSMEITNNLYYLTCVRALHGQLLKQTVPGPWTKDRTVRPLYIHGFAPNTFYKLRRLTFIFHNSTGQYFNTDIQYIKVENVLIPLYLHY